MMVAREAATLSIELAPNVAEQHRSGRRKWQHKQYAGANADDIDAPQRRHTNAVVAAVANSSSREKRRKPRDHVQQSRQQDVQHSTVD
jgi:hypothetical protein